MLRTHPGMHDERALHSFMNKLAIQVQAGFSGVINDSNMGPISQRRSPNECGPEVERRMLKHTNTVAANVQADSSMLRATVNLMAGRRKKSIVSFHVVSRFAEIGLFR